MMPRLALDSPTEVRTCGREGCRRTVGPYYDPRQADAALADHVHIAHEAVTMDAPAAINGREPASAWPPVHTA